MNSLKLGIFDCSTGTTNIIYAKDDLIVRTSSTADQTYIDKLQKENSYAVGFIQRTVWDEYVFGGKRNFVVFICEKNGDRVGYVLITPGRLGYHGKIQQIAIQEDARRLDYGSALVEAVRKFCKQTGRMGVTLRCRKDLNVANFFWKAIGFTLYGIWEKGKYNHVGFKASNDIFLWKIDLNDELPTLFTPTIFYEHPPRI